MNRRGWLGAGVALLAGGAGAGWAMWRQRRGDDAVATAGGPVPTAQAVAAFWSLRFDQPGGGELVLSTLRGKPLLLNFWATWCPPCVKEMPLLDGFHRDHVRSGWQVVGLAIDGPTPVRDFLVRRPVGFAIGLAGLDGVALTQSLGNAGGQLPFSVVFDREGRVRHRQLGTVDETLLAGWVSELS